MGTALLIAGHVREAVAALERAAETSTHAAHHNLAVALRARGDIIEALAHAARARELAPRCAATIALVGSLHDLAGDRETAFATFRAAVEVDPDHEVSRYYLAIAHARVGDRRTAIALLDGLAHLPALVLERVRGQIADLRAGDGPIEVDLCSIPIVSEVIGAESVIDIRPVPLVSRGAARAIDLDEAVAIVTAARRIVALTGAGISAASGLATRKELWQRHERDGAVSIARFRRDPSRLWTVVRDFLAAGEALPNAAHRALAALPRLNAVITQNVDGLHQAAGTRCPIIELHGTLLETRCDRCGSRPGLSCAELLDRDVVPPPCACGDVLRPDVVLFGEWVDRERLAGSAAAIARCDVLLVIGTAADVAPAADLAMLAASRGAIVIEIKRTASRLRASGALHLAGTAEDLLPRIVERLA